MNLKSYPNLEAILIGTVSGSVTEWPFVRRELERLIDDYDDLLHQLDRAELMVDELKHLLNKLP